MSAYSNGSVRRLNSLGTRSGVNGSAQMRSVPWQRCSANTIFQFSNRMATSSRVVVEVEESAPRAVFDLAHQVRQQVEPVDVDLVLGVSVGPGLVALLQLVADVGIARRGEQRGQPVVVLDDVVGYAARLDLSGPADQLRHPVRALPVGVLLAAERRGARVRPAVAVRSVVGGVDDDGVVGDAELVEHVEHLCPRSCRGRSSCRGSSTATAPPARRCSGLVWVNRCMWVKLHQTKNGLPASCWRLM